MTSDLYAITGINTNLWIAGSEGVLLTSIDGGTSWTAVESEFTGTWFSIAFLNSSHGFVTGSAGTLARTTDGGASWVFISTGTIANLYTQAWLNSTHGWLAGGNGVLLFTQDSGLSWTPRSFPWVNDLRAIAFFNNTYGWVAGTNGLIARTTDSGVSWTAVSVLTTAKWVVLKIIDGSTVWVAGTGGNLLITTDAGTTWNKAPVETTGTITTITSFFSSNILIAGENGFCAITDSTGSTFTMQEISTTLSLWAGYYSSSASWLVGDNGLIISRLDTIPPAAINNLETRNPTTTSLTLRWTAPGDDGMTGTATGYVVKYFTSEINAGNWNSATTYSQTWLPKSGGASESHVVTGLGSNKLYWFAIKAFDDRGNFGSISNSQSGKTKAPPTDGDGDGGPPPPSNQAPTVTLTFPNGGEVLTGDVAITWEASDPDDDQLLYTLTYWNGLSGAPWVLLVEQLSEPSYSWDTTTVPDGLTYLVQVEVNDTRATATDESDAPFSINNVNLAPDVEVISPNGGEVWIGTQLIEWTASDPDADILTYTVQYTLDGGVTWMDLATDLATPSYPWDTTQVADSSTCLIRVVASDGILTGEDSSDAPFTIANVPPTTEPEVEEFRVGGALGMLTLVGVIVGYLLPLFMIQRRLRK